MRRAVIVRPTLIDPLRGARAVVALLLLALPSAAQCDGFFPPLVRGVGAEPTDVVLRDLDGDGGDDILTANRLSDDLSLVANAFGTFGTTTTVPLSPGDAPVALATGELFPLGGRDVAVACAGSDAIRLLRNDPVGTLVVTATLTGPGRVPSSVAVADLDGTGVDDVVAGFEGDLLIGGDGVAVSLGGGPLAFLPAPVEGTGRVRRVVAADLDGDGDRDVAATTTSSVFVPLAAGRVLLWENDGAGSFTLAGALVAPTPDVEGLAAGDLDGDGSTDLAVTVQSFPPGPSEGVLLHLHDGAPSLSPARFTTLGPFGAPGQSFPTDVVISDLADDGIPGFLSLQDVVTLGFGAEQVLCLRSFDGIGFASSSTTGAGTAPRALAAGDLTADGLPDLVVAGAASDDVSIFRAIPTALSQEYGSGCAGTGGLVPQLTGVGLPVFSSLYELQLSDALPFSPAIVLVALEPAEEPLGGGCTLLLSQPTLGPAVTDALGGHSLLLTMPAAIPVFIGLDAYFQYAVLDPAGSWANLAFSNGVRIKIGV